MIHRLHDRWRSLTPRERVLILVGTVIVSGSLAFAFVVDPIQERLDLAERRIVARERIVAELREVGAHYKAALAQLDAAEARLTPEEFSVLSYLEEASKRAQLRERIVAMQPQVMPPVVGYRETSVELRFDSVAWPQLLSLLVALEDGPHRVEIKRVQATSRFDAPHLLDATVLVSAYARER